MDLAFFWNNYKSNNFVQAIILIMLIISTSFQLIVGYVDRKEVNKALKNILTFFLLH